MFHTIHGRAYDCKLYYKTVITIISDILIKKVLIKHNIARMANSEYSFIHSGYFYSATTRRHFRLQHCYCDGVNMLERSRQL